MSKKDSLLVNWSVIVSNLQRDYGTLTAIGRAVDSNYHHMLRLSTGEVMETGFSVGIKLLDLHLIHSPNKNDDINEIIVALLRAMSKIDE